MMNDHKPAGAKARAGEAQVITKADIADMIAKGIDVGVRKAIAPIIDENKKLRKSHQGLVDRLRIQDLEFVAKSDLGELGQPASVARIIKSLEDSNLSANDLKRVLTILKQANAVKKEAGKLLYREYGSSRAALAPESARAKVDQMAQSIVDKSDKPIDISIARTKVYKSHPELREQVKAEERAERETRWGVS